MLCLSLQELYNYQQKLFVSGSVNERHATIACLLDRVADARQTRHYSENGKKFQTSVLAVCHEKSLSKKDFKY